MGISSPWKASCWGRCSGYSPCFSSVSLPWLIGWRSSASHAHSQHPATPTPGNLPRGCVRGNLLLEGMWVTFPHLSFPLRLSFFHPSTNAYWARAVETGRLLRDMTVEKVQSFGSSAGWATSKAARPPRVGSTNQDRETSECSPLSNSHSRFCFLSWNSTQKLVLDPASFFFPRKQHTLY